MDERELAAKERLRSKRPMAACARNAHLIADLAASPRAVFEGARECLGAYRLKNEDSVDPVDVDAASGFACGAGCAAGGGAGGGSSRFERFEE